MSTYYEKPTILEMFDEGDEDRHLWVIMAAYHDQTAEVVDRDWRWGERRAIDAVKAKVAAAAVVSTPDTDHDFNETE